MEQKTKFIIMGLGVFLAISIFITLQTYTTKEKIRREREELININTSLGQKIDATMQDNQKLKEKMDSMNNDLNKISQEKADIQGQKDELERQKEGIQARYESIAKERDELVEKLKAQPAAEETKEAPVSTDAYWAGVLKEKTELVMVVGNMRSELSALKIKNDELSRDLGNLNRERDELEQQLNYNQKMFDSMASELVLERNAKRLLQESSGSLRNENIILRRQLKGINRLQSEMEHKLVKLQAEKSDIEKRFNEMADVLEDRLSKVNEIKQQLGAVRSGSGGEIAIAQPEKEKEFVELPPIVVRPQSEKITPEETLLAKGRVLEINKENNFVIIDAGEESGVKMGDTFQVYNLEGQAIATIEAIQVRPKITACDIKKETTPIIVGDTVR
jgi:myosin heavy subunit